MALSIYKKLGLQEPQPTCISIQLADRTLTYPRGMVEDLLVKVDKFIFPTNFMILDIEEEKLGSKKVFIEKHVKSINSLR